MSTTQTRKLSTVFEGIELKAVDAKNRVGIPQLFRKEIPEEESGMVILVGGIDSNARYVEVWTPSTWERRREQVHALKNGPQKMRMIRGYLSRAVECKVDRQGRINLTPYFRDWANLHAEVLWVGAGQMMELWDKKTQEDYENVMRAEAFSVYLENPEHFDE